MNPIDIAKAVGLHHNGVWQVDEARFREAVKIAYNNGYDHGLKADRKDAS